MAEQENRRRKRPVEHAQDLERTVRAIAVYAIALMFLLCMIRSGGNTAACCGPVERLIGPGDVQGAPAATPEATPTSSAGLEVRFADLDLGEDPCEESLRRWGTRLRGCPGPTAGDRWQADQEAGELEQAFAQLEVQNAGDALLWLDDRGNLVIAVPVERILLPGVRSVRASVRCRESRASAVQHTVVCLADDRLAPEHWED